MCIACASPDNWDAAYPIFRRLPNVPGAGVQTTADKIGLGIVGVTGAAVIAHAIGKEIKKVATRKKEPPAPKAGAKITGI